MKNSSDNRRLINTELQKRGNNKRIKKMLHEHTPAEEQDDMHIDFYCECSAADCTVRVPMTFEEYERFHEEQSRFVLATGHQSPAVEKVIGSNAQRLIVDKPALS